MEEPPRIVIWKALMLEVMKRVEEAISREKQDPATLMRLLSHSALYRNTGKVRKSVCCPQRRQAQSRTAGLTLDGTKPLTS